jgi:photosystem II stability/assembly factor-like uncharacterized protein
LYGDRGIEFHIEILVLNCVLLINIKTLNNMKKHLPILLILSALCTINQPTLSQDCTYSWSSQNSGTTHILYTCKAVSELVCWAAGANATVLRTTDGGDIWLNANLNPGIITGEVRNMEAINANTAWVTTESQMSTAIYKTTDGGDSWFQVYSNTAGFIKGIRMLDQVNGIAIGNPVSDLWNVLLTTDGGNTWQPSPNRPSANIIHQAVHNSFQVSMPNIYWGTSFTSIFRSTDGGLTYSEHETTGAGIYIFSLFINSSGTGLAASTAMSRSTDGGITFQPHSVPGAGNINGIESSGNNFWFIRGEKIFHSTDDGINWIEAYTAPFTLAHLDFPDNLNECQMGWAVGFGGTILKMTGSTVTSVNDQSEMPDLYELKQNYPNPFNPVTNIQFYLPEQMKVKLSIHNVLGETVKILINSELGSGNYSLQFDGSGLASGIYFLILESRQRLLSRKIVLLK